MYDCISCSLTKRMEKKLDRNYTKMLHDVLNKSWKQHLTKSLLCSHLLPILQSIHIKRGQAKYAEHFWRSNHKLISIAFLWTSTLRQTSADRPSKTFIDQLCADNRFRLDDMPRMMAFISENLHINMFFPVSKRPKKSPTNHATIAKRLICSMEILFKTGWNEMVYYTTSERWWGIGEKGSGKQNINPIGFPSIPTSMMWRVDCFLLLR